MLAEAYRVVAQQQRSHRVALGVFGALVSLIAAWSLGLQSSARAQAAPPSNCTPVSPNLVCDSGFEDPSLPVDQVFSGGFPDASAGPWFAGSAGTEIVNRVLLAPNSGS